MLTKLGLILAAVVVGALPLLAADGAIEINQAGVEQAGGFPFTITEPGSYVLTGNLAPGSGTAIEITDAGDVTIDLNGFTISASNPKNAGGSSAKGIFVGVTGISGDALSRVSVFNGKIRGFGSGISLLGEGNEVKMVTVAFNGTGIRLQPLGYGGLHAAPGTTDGGSGAKGLGMGVGMSNIVENCNASNNIEGIAGASINITGVIASDNSVGGINCMNCTISDSVVTDNGNEGIVCSGCTISNNRIGNNEGAGVRAFASLFTGNTVYADADDGDGPALDFPNDDVGWSNNVISDSDVFEKAVGLAPGKAVRFSPAQAKGFPGIDGQPMGCNVINNSLFCVYPEIDISIHNDF